jgi:hypothetical protein
MKEFTAHKRAAGKVRFGVWRHTHIGTELPLAILRLRNCLRQLRRFILSCRFLDNKPFAIKNRGSLILQEAVWLIQ